MRRQRSIHHIVYSGQGEQSERIVQKIARPKEPLCIQLAELEKEYVSLLQMQQHCVGQSSILSSIMEKMLSWSGCLTSNELRVQKRRLAILLRQQQQFSRQQHTLMKQLAQLRERQQILWRELYYFLLGKEKENNTALENIHMVDY